MDGIVSEDEAHELLSLAKKGFSATEGSAGDINSLIIKLLFLTNIYNCTV